VSKPTLIDAFFEAVGHESAWVPALDRLKDHFGAQQVAIQNVVLSARQRGVHFAYSGVAPATLIEYHAHYEAEDPWASSALQRRLFFEGSVVRGADLVPPERLRQTRFWRDFLVHEQVVDMLAGVLEMPAELGCPPTIVSLRRTGDAPLFQPDDEAALRALLPDLRRALQLQRRLAPQLVLGQSLRTLYDGLAVPMAFIDQQGRLHDANRAAQASVAEAGFLRTAADGGLHWRTDVPGWQPLRPLLDTLRVLPSVEQLLVAETGAACIAVVLAARGSFRPLDEAPVQALLSLRPIDLERDAERLQRRFRLTPAEWRTAALLATGLDADSLADRLAVRVSTVRTHVRNLLAKTGSAHQVQLVARLRGKA